MRACCADSWVHMPTLPVPLRCTRDSLSEISWRAPSPPPSSSPPNFFLSWDSGHSSRTTSRQHRLTHTLKHIHAYIIKTDRFLDDVVPIPTSRLTGRHEHHRTTHTVCRVPSVACLQPIYHNHTHSLSSKTN